MNESLEPVVARMHDWIHGHRDEMVSQLQGALRIASVADAPETGAPFGRAVRDALDYTLSLCDRLGFRTRNVDGYAGHAEFGTGDTMVAAIGHLDVVPEGSGWTHSPYGAEVEDGFIYARGAADDKGPMYAALFGAKALMESGAKLSRRVRVIFGCNEESGFECVRHYWGAAQEERPLYAFTPDASFPLVYAEKGIANFVLEKEVPVVTSGVHIARARGGHRPNMVPDSAEAELIGPPEQLLRTASVLQQWWDRNVTFEIHGAVLLVRATGKSAHGSRPTAGDNAILRLATALTFLELSETAAWLEFIRDAADTTGSALGLARGDDIAGPLTSNLGLLEYSAPGAVRLTLNIRYPVMSQVADLVAASAPSLARNGWALAERHDQPPLHVPLDQEPVSTLLRVYRQETGDMESGPTTMGGGTYARATPHAVAFGASFPGGQDGPAHEPDERFAVATYLKAARIYAHALYELAR